MAASFEDDAIRLQLGAARPAALSLTFENASPEATLIGQDPRSSYYNFFLGNDPTKWRSQVAAYASLLYRGIYDGVDVRVHEAAEQLEYDLTLAAGAALEQVVIRADGASGIELAADGSLILHTGSAALRQSPPTTWEVLPSGEQQQIESRFHIIDAQRYGFEVVGRDRNLPLIIDPGLEWATYLGGGNWDEIHDIAAVGDGTGDVIAVGATPRVHVTSSNALIGTLRNEGGGRYRGDFSWSSNPQNITVRSSLGGSASRAVIAR